MFKITDHEQTSVKRRIAVLKEEIYALPEIRLTVAAKSKRYRVVLDELTTLKNKLRDGGESESASAMTPEQREFIKQRMADLAARMHEVRPTVNLDAIDEWARLYAERELLNQQLDD